MSVEEQQRNSKQILHSSAVHRQWLEESAASRQLYSYVVCLCTMRERDRKKNFTCQVPTSWERALNAVSLRMVGASEFPGNMYLNALPLAQGVVLQSIQNLD